LAQAQHFPASLAGEAAGARPGGAGATPAVAQVEVPGFGSL
jgi:hypothetical protein